MSDKGATAALVTSYTASGSTFVFGAWTANEVAAIGGLTIAILTFFMSWFYQHKRYQLEKASANDGACDSGANTGR